jgi:8-oxo-dGTP diphosphatase
MGRGPAHQIAVVAAMVARDGRFLMGKRSAHKTVAPGTWCTVTGHIEPGESAAQAAVREVGEETGLVVCAREEIARTDTRDRSAHIQWWWATPVDDSPARQLGPEHSELRWVTLGEMRRLDPVFVEDVEIFARLAARLAWE